MNPALLAELSRHDVAAAEAARYPALHAAWVADGQRLPPAPDRPVSHCPTEAQVAAARHLISDAERATVIGEERRAAATRARVEVDASTIRAEAAQREATVSVALLAACRRAIGDEAARSLAALGGMQGVSVTFAGPDRGKNDPYVSVTYRGLDFALLSAGERVLADLLLRLGLRRACGLPLLPVVIDDAGALNGGAGPWPDAGVSIMLVTT